MARWKPKIGETYYHVNRDGVPTKETWNDGVLDNHRYNHGNCYDSLRLEIKTDPIDKKSIVGKLFQVWWSTKRGDNMAMVLDVLPYTGKYIQYFDAILVLEPRANSLYSNKPIQMSVQLKDCKFFDVGSWPSTTPWKPTSTSMIKVRLLRQYGVIIHLTTTIMTLETVSRLKGMH